MYTSSKTERKKGLVNCVWHQMLSVFKHHWVTGAKSSVEMCFWEILTLLIDLIKPFFWTDGGSAEGGSRQSLFTLWQWTSWAPGMVASQFDFHQDIDSN